MAETGYPERGVTMSVHCLKRVPESSRMMSFLRHHLCSPHPTSGSTCECLYKGTHIHTHTQLPHYKAATACQPSRSNSWVWSDSQGVLGNPYNTKQSLCLLISASPGSCPFLWDLSQFISSEKITKRCCIYSPHIVGRGGRWESSGKIMNSGVHQSRVQILIPTTW